MVRKILARTLLPLSCALALGSCGFLLGTVFPEDLTQVSARIDLSGKIPKDAVQSFALSAVTAGGKDYAVLASNFAHDGIDVFIMDRNLNVVATYTYDELNAPYASSKPFQGNLAMVDCNSLVVVGNRWFFPSKEGFTLLTQPSLTTSFTSPWGWGFALPALNRNVANVSISAVNTLSHTVWMGDWSGFTTYSASIDPLGTKDFDIVGVFSDPAAQVVVLVLHEMNMSFDDYFVIPWANFAGALVSPLRTIYSGSHFTRPRSEPRVVGYAQYGIIAFSPSGGDQRSGDMVRFDLAGNLTSNSLKIGKLKDVQNAYLAAGGCYYSFNRETRVVTKINAWW